MEYIEKPSPRRRENFLTREEYKPILAKITSKRFQDLIIAAWETGARPQKLIPVEVGEDSPSVRRVCSSCGQVKPAGEMLPIFSYEFDFCRAFADFAK
jgi:hypothetical protein